MPWPLLLMLLLLPPPSCCVVWSGRTQSSGAFPVIGVLSLPTSPAAAPSPDPRPVPPYSSRLRRHQTLPCVSTPTMMMMIEATRQQETPGGLQWQQRQAS